MFGKMLPGVRLQQVRVVRVVQPYLINLVGDDRLPLFSLLEPHEVGEMTVGELREVIIERMSALAELLDGIPIAILCDDVPRKALLACVFAKTSSRMPLGEAFFRMRIGCYRSIGRGPTDRSWRTKEDIERALFEHGEDLDDFLSRQYVIDRVPVAPSA